MKNTNDLLNPYLQVLRFGVCPECLQYGVIDSVTCDGTMYHYHCDNQSCTRYMKDVSVPFSVFQMLRYLEKNQPTVDS